MRILVVTQYFWPESFRINDLCLGLKERGHEVVVLTGKPNYPKGEFYEGYSFSSKSEEVWEGIKVYRSALIPRGKGGAVRLFINYFSFAILASFKVFSIKERFDKIFVCQFSPVTVGIPAIVAKLRFKVKMYLWVQDLWPESLTAAGNVKNKVVIGFFNWLTKFIYKYCDLILIQSAAFKAYIMGQGVEENKLVYYPNSTESFYKIVPPDEQYQKKLPAGFKVMFAGNIGESQGFDTILGAAKILIEKGIHVNWVILGDGRMMPYVKSKIKEFNIESSFHLLGAYPVTEMPYFFSCADALLVSLKKDNIFTLTIPSKIQSYLACGKPIIGSLDGEGARIIREAQAGIVGPSENQEALTQSVEKIYSLSNDERTTLGINGRNYFEKEFERENLLKKLDLILMGYCLE